MPTSATIPNRIAPILAMCLTVIVPNAKSISFNTPTKPAIAITDTSKDAASFTKPFPGSLALFKASLVTLPNNATIVMINAKVIAAEPISPPADCISFNLPTRSVRRYIAPMTARIAMPKPASVLDSGCSFLAAKLSAKATITTTQSTGTAFHN